MFEMVIKATISHNFREMLFSSLLINLPIDFSISKKVVGSLLSISEMTLSISFAA